MNIREVVARNLQMIRKENKLTQVELSKKINYSDKAISRWEKGEVLPDIEVLQSISKVYGVHISFFFEEQPVNFGVNKNLPGKNDVLMHMLSVCVIWTVLSILFVYVNTIYNYVLWQAFVWGVPITVFFTLRFYKKWQKDELKMILRTILVWSFLACVYLQFISYNMWLLFIIGIPVQAGIIVSYLSNKNKRNID